MAFKHGDDGSTRCALCSFYGRGLDLTLAIHPLSARPPGTGPRLLAAGGRQALVQRQVSSRVAPSPNPALISSAGWPESTVLLPREPQAGGERAEACWDRRRRRAERVGCWDPVDTELPAEMHRTLITPLISSGLQLHPASAPLLARLPDPSPLASYVGRADRVGVFVPSLLLLKRFSQSQPIKNAFFPQVVVMVLRGGSRVTVGDAVPQGHIWEDFLPLKPQGQHKAL